MIIYQKIKDPLITQRVLWWSVGGSNLQAIAEHVEMKGGQHAIFFHPITHPTSAVHKSMIFLTIVLASELTLYVGSSSRSLNLPDSISSSPFWILSRICPAVILSAFTESGDCLIVTGNGMPPTILICLR